jgi:hypothetical protein
MDSIFCLSDWGKWLVSISNICYCERVEEATLTQLESKLQISPCECHLAVQVEHLLSSLGPEVYQILEFLDSVIFIYWLSIPNLKIWNFPKFRSFWVDTMAVKKFGIFIAFWVQDFQIGSAQIVCVRFFIVNAPFLLFKQKGNLVLIFDYLRHFAVACFWAVEGRFLKRRTIKPLSFLFIKNTLK